MRKSSQMIAVALATISLTSCASLTTGTNQNVSVKTGNIQGALCSLQNNKGKWYVNGTPGSVVINRSYNDLSVDCTKSGYPAGHQLVKSHTKGMAFGNVIIGGVVGAGVDIASGAAYDYPNEINVPLKHNV